MFLKRQARRTLSRFNIGLRKKGNMSTVFVTHFQAQHPKVATVHDKSSLSVLRLQMKSPAWLKIALRNIN